MDFYPSGIFLQTKSMSYSIILFTPSSTPKRDRETEERGNDKDGVQG